MLDAMVQDFERATGPQPYSYKRMQAEASADGTKGSARQLGWRRSTGFDGAHLRRLTVAQALGPIRPSSARWDQR
jgi:hypothetical protein